MTEPVTSPLDADERAELERLRAEVQRLRESEASAPTRPIPPATAPPVHRHRVRRSFAALLIVLGCVIAPLAVVASWLDRVVTDTDNYVETVAPLIEDPAVQAALADAVTRTAIEGLDVEGLTEQALQALVDRTDLPPLVQQRITGLSEPITNGIEGFVDDQVTTLVGTAEFQTTWVEANRVAHQELVSALTGEEGGGVVVEEGTVSVNIAPFVQILKQRLIDRGFQAAERIPDVSASFVVLQSADIGRAQSIFATLEAVGSAMPFVVLLILAVGVLLATDRRRALVRAGIGLALAMFVLAVVISLARAGYLRAVPPDLLPRDAAATVFDTLVRWLRTGLRTGLVLGLVVALAAYLAGPGEQASRARAAIGRGVTRLRTVSSGGHGLAGDRVGAWVGLHRQLLQITSVALGAMVVVFWDRPTPLVLLGVAGAVLVLLVLIEVLAAEPRAST